MASKTEDTSQDAIDEDEIAGAAVPGPSSIDTDAAPQSQQPKQQQQQQQQQRTAFSASMSPKPKPKPKPATTTTTKSPAFQGRNGLGAYLADPTSFPPGRVIYHTEKWVVINDLYPKSSVHILLLPRDATKNRRHPFDALDNNKHDPEFLADVQAETKKLRGLVAKELRRRYGKFSAQDRRREEALVDALDADAGDGSKLSLPAGRDWEKEVLSGVHAHPSMNHLHVHVLSRDRVSECMKKKIHYNSFATPFLVAVEDFPLAGDDVRRHPGRQGYLDGDLKCWRCGRGFGNRFARLKEHLAEELELWKRE
ncbi:MAG: aprataxin-like protein [Peltula sp. TS41687]|nr:MAG: aprataxin-like protein [Peltula sp. TS41687]